MGYLWNIVVDKAKDVDAWRKMHMAFAEWVDAWRLVPRALVAGYAYMTWVAVKWYMSLDAHLIPGCDIEKLADKCIVDAPNTNHAILLTTIVGVAAAVFALYTNSGKKWNGFTHWNIETQPAEPAERAIKEKKEKFAGE